MALKFYPIQFNDRGLFDMDPSLVFQGNMLFQCVLQNRNSHCKDGLNHKHNSYSQITHFLCLFFVQLVKKFIFTNFYDQVLLECWTASTLGNTRAHCTGLLPATEQLAQHSQHTIESSQNRKPSACMHPREKGQTSTKQHKISITSWPY